MIARVQTLSSTLDVSPLTPLRPRSSASVHPLPAGRFFPRIFCCFFSLLSSRVFSLLPSMSLNTPLSHPLFPHPSSRFGPFYHAPITSYPRPVYPPFSCIYIYLCSSNPWIKLHHGDRTTLADELAIGRIGDARTSCCGFLNRNDTAIHCPVGRAVFILAISTRLSLCISSLIPLPHLKH